MRALAVGDGCIFWRQTVTPPRSLPDVDQAGPLKYAEAYLFGQGVLRDLRKARQYYALAARQGSSDAEQIYVALLGSGPGESGRNWHRARQRLRRLAAKYDWAARQNALLEGMAINDEGDPQRSPPRRVELASPMVASSPQLLSRAECRYLIETAFPGLAPASVVDPTTGAFIQDPVRRALCCAFPFVREDLVIHAINRRIAAFSDTSWDRGEPAQVLVYRPGDEYRLHNDALPAGTANQRVRTVLVALNDTYEGGHTTFPHLGIAWRGKPGDALMFDSVRPNGTPEPLSEHCGSPVVRGQKAILSRWIRERPLDLG